MLRYDWLLTFISFRIRVDQIEIDGTFGKANLPSLN